MSFYLEFGRLFQQQAADALQRQRQRRRQAADAAADNDDRTVRSLRGCHARSSPCGRLCG